MALDRGTVLSVNVGGIRQFEYNGRRAVRVRSGHMGNRSVQGHG